MKLVLEIAFPMIVSQGAETIMLFTDRMFLSYVSPLHLAASMSGGLLSFSMMTFFLGTLNYITAMTGQYYGVKRHREVGYTVGQGIWSALLAYPLIIIGTYWVLNCLPWFGHTNEQMELTREYARILVWGSIFVLLRTAIGGFFSGIGKTKNVMIANLIAMGINIPANYIFIFGRLGFPALGIKGAAYGTILGSLCGLLFLIIQYSSSYYRQEYYTWHGLRWHSYLFKKLWKFGYPAGIDFFLNMLAFTLFVQSFHGYGKTEAAAVTMVFNWDLISFLPITGIGIAMTSLVGRYSAQQSWSCVDRTVRSGLILGLGYSGIMTFLFLTMAPQLIQFFTSSAKAQEDIRLFPLAVTLLRLASIYLTSDCLHVVFGGALRGAGDTRWPMVATVLINWFMSLLSLLMIRFFHISPIGVWLFFALMITVLATVLIVRFRSKYWQKIPLIEESSLFE